LQFFFFGFASSGTFPAVAAPVGASSTTATSGSAFPAATFPSGVSSGGGVPSNAVHGDYFKFLEK
jgi:hypothetical protein